MNTIKQIDGYKIYMNQMLGQGSYGAVYIGVSEKTNQKVAIKILKKSSIDSDEYLKSALFSEIKIMQAVQSENIVGFHDVMESRTNYYLVQELCDGDFSSIVKPGHSIPEKEARGYLLQICNGFLALVREGIVHRDLKPANIMRKGNTLKLGDFGFAKKTEGTSVKNQTIVGTPLYMSLQILKGEAYSSKCDIWALGFIYYEMLHGHTPWIGKSQFDLIKKIESRPLEFNSGVSEESKDFLRKCLQLTEQKRISWDQLFVHPIFNGYFLKNCEGNMEFQNKLKMVMSDLRFEINSHNLDLYKILTGLGYKSGEVELDHDHFYQFLKIVSPTLTRSESDYIFAKTDIDSNGTISIQEIQQVLNAHNISLRSMFQHIPGVGRMDSNQSIGAEESSGFILSEESEQKIQHCFIKLFKILQKQNKILWDVFAKFDKEKSGSLDRMEFKKMLKQLSPEIDNDEIEAAFDIIDSDKSNSIEFSELNCYFSKVNGIPEHLNIPQQKSPPNFFQKIFEKFSGHTHSPPPPPQYYQQGGFNHGYYPSPQPQFNMYQQPQPQMYGGYQQMPSQPGMMGNPFNQLSQNMNSGHMNQSNQQHQQQQHQGWGKGW